MVVENLSVDESLVSNDNLGHTELDIGDVVLTSLYENGDDLAADHIFSDEWHYLIQGVKTADTIVIALLVHIVVVDDDRHELFCDPLSAELIGKLSTFCLTHTSDTSCSVGQVTHEDTLQVLDVGFFPKDESKVCDKFKNCHSHSPLSVLTHVGQGGQET